MPKDVGYRGWGAASMAPTAAPPRGKRMGQVMTMEEVEKLKLDATGYAKGTRGKLPKLGSGKRFAAVEAAARASGARNPAAVAAAAGIKKYGKTRMAKLAAAGRRRRAK